MEYELSRSQRNNYLYLHDAQNLTFASHMHSSFEFIYVQEGELYCSLGENTFILHPNEAILIPPNRFHSFETKTFSKNKTLIFSADFVPTFYTAMKNATFLSPVFVFPSPEAFDHLQEQDIFLAKAILYYICGVAYKNCRPVEMNNGNEILIQKITLYLQKNFREDVQLDTLARALNYNSCYLSAFINLHFGMNLRSVLNGYRIDYARHLLESDENVSITDVSVMCGFTTIRSFNRAFLKETGCSPRDYKKRLAQY